MVRWTPVVVLVGIAAIFPHLMPWPYPILPIGVVALLAALLNLVWKQWARRGIGLATLSSVQAVSDVVLVTAVIQLTGGVDSPFHWLYAGPIIMAALTRGWGLGLATAGLSLAGDAGVLALQYLEILPHVHVDAFAVHDVARYRDPAAISINIAIYGAFFGVTAVACSWFQSVMADTSNRLMAARQGLLDREKRLRQVLGRLVCVQEAERKRIARELHDDSNQLLSAVLVQAQRLAHEADRLPSDLREAASRTADLTREAVESVQRAILDLRPPALDRLGFIPAVREFLSERVATFGLEARLDAAYEGRLSPEAETGLFRAVQAALTNAVRHSQARRVSVRIARENGELVVSVEDDGIGFEPGEVMNARPERSLGLSGIRERLELLGGRAEIRSSPGRGTRVEMRVPVVTAAGE